MPLPQDKANQAYGSTVGQAGHAAGGGAGASHTGGERGVKDYNAQVLDALKAGAQPTTVGAATQHVRVTPWLSSALTAMWEEGWKTCEGVHVQTMACDWCPHVIHEDNVLPFSAGQGCSQAESTKGLCM